MKSQWCFLILILLIAACVKSEGDRPSVSRISYVLKSEYKDTLVIDLVYRQLSGMQKVDSFELNPGTSLTMFSLADIKGSFSEFKCSDQLVSLKVTNHQGTVRLRNDPLLSGWWEERVQPVGSDTFHICTRTLDSAEIRIIPDPRGGR